MKKITTIILVSVMTTSLICGLTGCSPFDEGFKRALKTDVYSTYEEMKTIYKKSDSPSGVFDELEKWGDKNEFYVNRIGDADLILMKPPTDGFETAPVTTLQCSVSMTSVRHHCLEAAIAMAAAKSIPEHGTVYLVFTTNENGNFVGAKTLPQRILKRTDNMINLTYSGDAMLFTSGAASSRYALTEDISYASPKGTNAYKLKISGLHGGDAGDRSKYHPNPIRVLGDFISACTQKGMVVELSSFDAYAHIGYYPRSAIATVVVSTGDKKAFLTRLDAAVEKFEDSNRDTDEDLSFEYKSVNIPRRVLSSEDTASVMGLMYTLDEDKYATTEPDDEGDVIAIQTTSSIRTENGRLRIGILGRSLDTDILKDMSRTIKKICNLNDVHYRLVDGSPLWTEDEDNTLADSFDIAAAQSDLNIETGPTFKESECAIFKKTRPDIQMISLGINTDNAYEFAQALVAYMDSLGGELNLESN